ncbi:MAG: TetR/AcrR family transcriptional regulator [Galbitalea sp.]
MTSTAHGARRQRSDAQRNVAALLDAAREVFARVGVDAPAKEITDLAGVGVGTLYRHFPHRSDLIAAVLQHEVDECVESAITLAASQTPLNALVAWIDRFTAFVGTKRGLATALHSGDPAFDGLPNYLFEQLVPVLDGLLETAKADNAVRADVDARDILLTVALLCHPTSSGDPRFSEHMIHVFIDGLRRA